MGLCFPPPSDRLQHTSHPRPPGAGNISPATILASQGSLLVASLIESLFIVATHIMAFDLQAAIKVLGSQAFNDIAHDAMGPTMILGIFWGMGEDVPDLLIGNCCAVTVH